MLNMIIPIIIPMSVSGIRNTDPKVFLLCVVSFHIFLLLGTATGWIIEKTIKLDPMEYDSTIATIFQMFFSVILTIDLFFMILKIVFKFFY